MIPLLSNPTAAATCAHRGRPVGFTAAFGPVPGQAALTVALSCGCRVPGTARVEISAFHSAPAITRTSCDPVTGEVRRGPLGATPVFYTRSAAGLVRVSTCLPDLVDENARPSAPAVAAALAGQPLPSPLTPWESVFRLPPGAVLSCPDGDRVRIRLDDCQWSALLPGRTLRQGGGDALLRAALTEALQDAAAECVAVSGGPASALLAELAHRMPARPPGRHVHVELPVLDRRRMAIEGSTVDALAEVEVVDGTAGWVAHRDAPVPPLPEQCDPWPGQVTAGLPAGARAASGYGLGLLFAAGRAVRRRRRWHVLTDEHVPPQLWGKSWSAGFRRAGGGPATPGNAPPPWFGPAAVAALRTAQAGGATSHLVPDSGDAQWMRGVLSQLVAVLDGCGLSRVDGPAGSGPAPVAPALHPAVVGVALYRASGADLPDLDRLLPAAWRPADPPVGGRDRLFAAGYVTRRLSSPQARADLLERVGGGDWVRADLVAAALAEPGPRLANSWMLHRLHTVALAHPELVGGVRS